MSASAFGTSGDELLKAATEALALAGEAHVEVFATLRDRGCARFAIGEHALGR